jgi:hypothetical protein
MIAAAIPKLLILTKELRVKAEPATLLDLNS